MASGTAITAWGNLGADPKLVTLPSGSKICEASMAVNLYQGKGQPERTLWLGIKCWGKRGEALAQHGPKKGQPILVSGKLDQETWDGRDGQPRSKLVIRANDWDFIGPRGGGGGGQPQHQHQPQHQPQQARQHGHPAQGYGAPPPGYGAPPPQQAPPQYQQAPPPGYGGYQADQPAATPY